VISPSTSRLQNHRDIEEMAPKEKDFYILLTDSDFSNRIWAPVLHLKIAMPTIVNSDNKEASMDNAQVPLSSEFHPLNQMARGMFELAGYERDDGGFVREAARDKAVWEKLGSELGWELVGWTGLMEATFTIAGRTDLRWLGEVTMTQMLAIVDAAKVARNQSDVG
jgi:hypothetical protein